MSARRNGILLKRREEHEGDPDLPVIHKEVRNRVTARLPPPTVTADARDAGLAQ